MTSKLTISHIETIIQDKICNKALVTGKIQTVSGKVYFLKTGSTSTTYQCEANGLEELKKAESIRIAKVFAAGNNFILTEYIEQGYQHNDFFEVFGKQFAQMHKTQSSHFGFYENNFIGANPQQNMANEEEKINWTAFFFNKRLLFQYRLAEKNGYTSPSLTKDFSELESKIEFILEGSHEVPSLLHGDLWSGNFICDKNGNPVLIDPAVYYGHREADLAMTKLFGGFAPSFYAAYQKEYPLPEGWQYRENIYKLYHVLNHLNIFGRSYLSEAEFIIQHYLKR